jgi:hypothetical protein
METAKNEATKTANPVATLTKKTSSAAEIGSA